MNGMQALEDARRGRSSKWEICEMKKFLLAATAAALVGLGSTGQAGANEIRYASAGDIYGLDPHSMTDSFSINFLQHIYEPLVRYNKELKIEPALAVSWEIIKPDVVRYKLRQGVKFHDGAEFSADDVVVSLTRATHERSPIKGNLPALKVGREGRRLYGRPASDRADATAQQLPDQHVDLRLRMAGGQQFGGAG
jgi:hypothetical protein